MRWWHIAEVIPIEVDLFGPEQWSAAMFWNELASGHRYRVILDNDGRVAAYAGLALTAPDEAWIQNVAVRRDVHRRGLGRTLLTHLLGLAAGRRVLLEVAVNNEPAQRLYAAHGFEPVDIRKGYYQLTNTDALVMARDEQ